MELYRINNFLRIRNLKKKLFNFTSIKKKVMSVIINYKSKWKNESTITESKN